MAARLVVIEGPDAGCEFMVPEVGGGIGRGNDNTFQLSDLSVSRYHSAIERRQGALVLVDKESRNRTMVNGTSVTTHALSIGDEITIGATRLAFLAADGGVTVAKAAVPTRFLLEVSTEELRHSLDRDSDVRLERMVHAFSDLGQRLAIGETKNQLAEAAGRALLRALTADRALILEKDDTRFVPLATVGGVVMITTLSEDVLASVCSQRKTIAMDAEGVPAALTRIATTFENTLGILYVDRRKGEWDKMDLLILATIAEFLATAWLSYDVRQHLAREISELRGTGTREARGQLLESPRPLHELEREAIVLTLEATAGNKARAAQLLEIDRSTLYKKLKDYGIDA